MHRIVLPILDANMTHGVVRAWFKREGDTVRAGEALFEVETDKVNAQVDAEVSGVLRRIVAPEGTRLAVLGLVGFVGSADEAVPAPETWSPPAAAARIEPRVGAAGQPTPLAPLPAREGGSNQLASSPLRRGEGPGERVHSGQEASATPAAAARPTASPAARRLARERGVALDSIRGSGARGEITRADVEAASARVTPAGGSGHLDPAFLNLLRRDAGALRALSSEAKLHLYRQHGAQIGDRVRLEPGAIIVAEAIVIGAGSVIGADSVIECEQLSLGRLVAFGRRTRVHCRAVEIGDALWSKDDVVIGVSIENLSRPRDEVAALTECSPRSSGCFRPVPGRACVPDPRLRTARCAARDSCRDGTQCPGRDPGNDGMCLNVALGYSGRDELVDAMRGLDPVARQAGSAGRRAGGACRRGGDQATSVHGRPHRSGPDHSHERRDALERLSALAEQPQRVLLHRRVLAGVPRARLPPRGADVSAA